MKEQMEKIIIIRRRRNRTERNTKRKTKEARSGFIAPTRDLLLKG